MLCVVRFVNCLYFVGVRESYVNLCSNSEDRLQIYRDNFEAAYIQSTELFYRLKSPEQLETNGVLAYMKYADAKLREEEARAQRYLEAGSNAVIQCCVKVLVGNTLPVLLAECASLIQAGETEKLQLMFRLLERVPEGVQPMLDELENHITQAGKTKLISSINFTRYLF